MKLIFALPLALIFGCKPTSSTSEQVSSAAVSASAVQTSAAVAVGAVRGVVRIVGDESPLMPKANEIPVGSCFSAHKMHSKVFRKAGDGGVADALVAVTEYSGEVPSPRTPVEVTMADCALSSRTIALTYGQTVHAKNVGIVAAIPQLQGAPQAALVVAIPGGDPIIMTPTHPGRYILVDKSHEYATADVFVLNYPTIDVSDEAGRFQIEGIPAGNVKVSARLADAGLTVEQRVVVEANKTTEVTLELHFERAQWQAALDEAKGKLDNQ